MELTKFSSQLFIGLEQITVHLHQKTLTALRRSVAGGRKLGPALQGGTSHLRKLLKISRNGICSTNAKITGQVFIGLGYLAIYLQQAQSTLVRLVRNVAGKPRRLQEALRAREDDLQRLLESSPDAVVVTDVGRRFVDANRKALDLFGVSESNMRKFTVDIFLSPGQISLFDGKVSPFRRPNAKYGKCEIRRLDGSLRVAEYRFFANFIPFRHVYRFCNVVATNQYQPPALRMGDPLHRVRSVSSETCCTHRESSVPSTGRA
jgi:PAS domain S-box-containing protein